MKEYYDELPKINGLNFVQLTPISFLQRAGEVYADQQSIVYGSRSYTWNETVKRCLRLAGGLRKLGVSVGSTVAMMAANTPELVEAHFGVPMSKGVLNSINTRLDQDTIAYILEHSDAEILITDTQFSDVISKALSQLKTKPIVIDIVDQELQDESGELLGIMTYEELLETAGITVDWGYPESEWNALTLNYTSGTSGRPKGVIYHHRGSYLMSMGTVAAWNIQKKPRYLYTVPMFHCNGWGHVWTIALMGGSMICTRVVSAETIFEAIQKYKVTNFGAAPIVLSMLANSPQKLHYVPDYTVEVMTAGAPPPSKVLEQVQKLGFNVTHVYGLTETFGHVVFCDWKSEWTNLDMNKQAEIKARQGVRFPMMDSVRVVNSETGQDVVQDGESMGEVVLCGNPVMKGYYKNPKATAEAFKGGSFHSGDLAVVYPDGYLEIKDRLKDIIISGGENISSIEVESALYKHPKVAAAAVIAKPDEKWGETPCAFVELKPGENCNEKDIIEFCREHLASFKRPRCVIFGELPKTSTGKIQKFELRQRIK
ncbi:MAG: AMP-binding protein [Gammaproteobacteria bacterium]|nr:AMP-binding protein [Gammaproteobacteria bacterium]MCY4218524.1 AMP-binding protein [Gammaproteobacteria bacterium]